ncbi:MAG: alanine:cation symporter family protein [Tildeniella torsiva UHER 1998/13D]|jgi:Na+/alanine symporter|nr:alanine:cation symporter family protein [Tildeniella torsiva UHER 1998/13D]
MLPVPPYAKGKVLPLRVLATAVGNIAGVAIALLDGPGAMGWLT